MRPRKSPLGRFARCRFIGVFDLLAGQPVPPLKKKPETKMTDCQNKSVTWKFVPDFGDYEVSEHGDLRRGTKHLKPERVQGSGRKRFPLSKDGRLYRISAHRLVALAFIGPKPFDGAEVCHRDGFIHNNHFSNLRWDTRSGNVVDAMRHKLTRVKRPRRGDRLAVACSEFLASKARRA